MAEAPAPLIERTRLGEVHHIVCCDDDTATCGTDVSAEPWGAPESPADCRVCIDLSETPCGAPFCPWLYV